MKLRLRGTRGWLVGVLVSVSACGGDFTSTEPNDGASGGDGDVGDGDSGDGDSGNGDGDGDGTGDGDTGDGDVGGSDGDGDDRPSGGASSSGGTTGTGGGMGMPPDGACPPAAPAPNMLCPSGLSCTYGDDPRVGCREVYTCDDSGRWQIASPDCPELPQCFGEGMEPIFDSVACTDPGDTCYVGGNSPVCVCTQCRDMSCDEKNSYRCLQPPEPCPELPPNQGQVCVGPEGNLEGTTCEYAACPSPFHVVMGCNGGVWNPVDVTCPDPN